VSEQPGPAATVIWGLRAGRRYPGDRSPAAARTRFRVVVSGRDDRLRCVPAAGRRACGQREEDRQRAQPEDHMPQYWLSSQILLPKQFPVAPVVRCG